MYHLHTSSRKGEATVFIDISSASIGVTIVVKDSKKGAFSWSTRAEYGYQSVDDFDRYVKTMYATLLEVGMKAKSVGFVELKKTFPHISVEQIEVQCVYGSPWVYSTVEVETKNTEKPFHITKRLCDKMQKDAQSKILDSKQVQFWQEVMGAGRIMKSYTDAIKLRGYTVNDLAIGKQTKDLKTQHFFSIIPESVGKHVEEVIEKLFPNQTLTYTTSTRTLLKSIQNIFQQQKISYQRMIFTEISGEMTTLTLVENGQIDATTSVSLGTNHLLRAIAPQAENAKEARGATEIMIKTKKDIARLNDLPDAFHVPMDEWRTKVFQAIKEITGGVTPPSMLIVIAEQFWEKIYTTVLGSPFTLTGTRNEINLDTISVSKLDKNKDKTQKDTRMYMYTHSV